MTTLLDKIQADSLAARKARLTDKALFLTTLLAEAAKVGKDVANRASTDDEVIAVVRKFIKNNQETITALWIPQKLDTDIARVARRRALMIERAFLDAYLPAQASVEEIKAAVFEIIEGLDSPSPKQMGVVMGALQSRFNGNFDRTLASALVKLELAP